jgi:abhydrolase domain-containing protein 6
MKIFLGTSFTIAAVMTMIYYLFPQVPFKLYVAVERKSSGLKEKKTEIKDHTVCYLEGGNKNPETILCVHGLGADKDNFTWFAKYLTDRYHVIIPDLPGNGESTRNPGMRYDIMSQVVRLDLIVKSLGLEKFDLVGSSMGGGIAGVYSAIYPEKVLSLALFNAAEVRAPVESERERIIRTTGKNPLLTYSVEDFDRSFSFNFVKTPYIPSAIKKYLAEQEVKKFAAIESDYNFEFGSKLYTLEKYIPEIKARTFILWGDTDNLVHVSSVEVLKKKIKYSEAVIMPQSGHGAFAERPEEAARHYLKFLEGK